MSKRLRPWVRYTMCCGLEIVARAKWVLAMSKHFLKSCIYEHNEPDSNDGEKCIVGLGIVNAEIEEIQNERKS